MRDIRERVLDILESIERIEKYARGGREEFVVEKDLSRLKGWFQAIRDTGGGD